VPYLAVLCRVLLTGLYVSRLVPTRPAVFTAIRFASARSFLTCYQVSLSRLHANAFSFIIAPFALSDAIKVTEEGSVSVCVCLGAADEKIEETRPCSELCPDLPSFAGISHGKLKMWPPQETPEGRQLTPAVLTINVIDQGPGERRIGCFFWYGDKGVWKSFPALRK